MSLHDTGLIITRHQLNHPDEPVETPPVLETVLKYNPNHGPDGRFTSGGGGGGGGRRGGTAGPPTTGAFGQKLTRYPHGVPSKAQQAANTRRGAEQFKDKIGPEKYAKFMAHADALDKAHAAEQVAAKVLGGTPHALRNRVNAIAPGKRLDYAESRVNRVMDYHEQAKTRTAEQLAATVARVRERNAIPNNPVTTLAAARQTMEFRKGMAPAVAQTMEFRHGVTEPGRMQTMEGHNAPQPRVQAASGLRVPSGYHAAGPLTRQLPPSGGFTSGQDYRRWQASKKLR